MRKCVLFIIFLLVAILLLVYLYLNSKHIMPVNRHVIEKLDPHILANQADDLLDYGYVYDGEISYPSPRNSYWRKEFLPDNEYITCELYTGDINDEMVGVEAKANWEYDIKTNKYYVSLLFEAKGIRGRFTNYTSKRSLEVINDEINRITEAIHDTACK